MVSPHSRFMLGGGKMNCHEKRLSRAVMRSNMRFQYLIGFGALSSVLILDAKNPSESIVFQPSEAQNRISVPNFQWKLKGVSA
jgi:hypothetical protein